MFIVAGAVATIRSGVAQRGSDAVAMAIVEGMIAIEVVMIVVDSPIVVMPSPSIMMVPVRVIVIPSPAVMESVIIPSIVIVVWTVVIARPPPVIAHIDTQAPVGRAIVVPIQVCEIGIIIAPTAVYIGVETTQTGSVVVIVIIVIVVIISSGATWCFFIGYGCVVSVVVGILISRIVILRGVHYFILIVVGRRINIVIIGERTRVACG